VNNEHHNGTNELPCKTVQENVLARLDNEHDEMLWSKVEKHLTTCDTCAKFSENCTALNMRLHEELKGDIDATALWLRIGDTLDAEIYKDEIVRRKPGGRMFAYGALAAVVLVAMFIVSPIHDGHSHKTPLTVTESINDFLTFRASGRKLDVSSSQPSELRHWFVKRLDFEVPLGSAMPAGFKLEGARLCSFLNRRLAAFMYHMGEKAASLYIMAETGLDATLKQVPKNNELTVFSIRGLTNVIWRNDGLLYIVVADFPEIEAVKFAQSVSKSSRSAPLKVTYRRNGEMQLAAIISAQFLKN